MTFTASSLVASTIPATAVAVSMAMALGVLTTECLPDPRYAYRKSAIRSNRGHIGGDACNAGYAHRLRYDQTDDDDRGQYVVPQPFGPITGEPVEDGNQFGQSL